MKIATWNVNSIRVRLPQVVDWLAAVSPDVACLQETKIVDESFPVEAFSALGYQVVINGQKTYNGVATLSRLPQSQLERALPRMDDPQRRFLATTVEGMRVINVYVPNGEAIDSPKYAYKLEWFATLRRYVTKAMKKFPRLVVLGDFNVAPEPRDVHEPKLWEGRVLFSESEREALSALAATGLTDLFRRFEQPSGSFSWWDYRQGAFRRNHGLRIDHILASEDLARDCRCCTIDKAPRALERPSDHAPVIAEFKK